MAPELIAVYVALGALVGFLAGLFGIGGGMTIVPILVALFTLEGFALEHVLPLAIGTAVATIVFTSLSSARAHHARGAVVVDRLDPRFVADRRASGLARTRGGGPGRTQGGRVGGAGLEDRSEPSREGEADQTARTGGHRSRIVAAVGSRGKPPVRRR